MTYTRKAIELEYIFLGMRFNIEFLDDTFSDDEKTDIVNYVNAMSKNIYVDKSYVECYENKRKATFMRESGWNALRDSIIDSRFCKYSFSNSEEIIADAFATIGKYYIYDCLAKKTDRLNAINVTVDPECEFDVIVCKDVSHDYANYIGQWQDWEFDENGTFISSSVTNNRKR